MLSANTPAFLKMLLVAQLLEKRRLPSTVKLPVVGGGGLIYECMVPPTFFQQYPPPSRDASRAQWRTFAYQLIEQVEFKLKDIQADPFKG